MGLEAYVQDLPKQIFMVESGPMENISMLDIRRHDLSSWQHWLTTSWQNNGYRDYCGSLSNGS